MQIRKNHPVISAVCAMLLTFMAFPPESRPFEDPLLSEWRDFSGRPECKKMLQWLRCQARARLTGTQCSERSDPDTVLPLLSGHLGLFVTLKKGNRVRGCYGAFSHYTATTQSLLSDYLTGALTRDPRYHPLDVSELADTRIIITITSQPVPVNDISFIDVRHFGIELLCGNETTVYVPAEIKSTSYIEKKINGTPCQIAMFKAVTLE
jgi:AMMECR1 domain-containing protein